MVKITAAEFSAEAFWARVTKSEGCWLWSGAVQGEKYGHLHVPGRPSGVNALAHRVAWTLARGPIPDGFNVLHSCDTPLCVRPDHLFLGSQADNIADMIRKGRQSMRHPRHGADNNNSTLTLEGFAKAKELRASGTTVAVIATQLGVTAPFMSNVLNGKTWHSGYSGKGSACTLRGTKVRGSKLTEETVLAARRRYAAGGVTVQALADEYGVDQGVMSCALTGRTWKHVPDAVRPTRGPRAKGAKPVAASAPSA